MVILVVVLNDEVLVLMLMVDVLVVVLNGEVLVLTCGCRLDVSQRDCCV